ncbi:hypothetical protein LF41_2737 [Lysobacter dokdonensis DS-58]|uniref:Uncharacterized protein n=1 Tax=Lysobacter dokdonensis DS-58 TaxID=1300345 RepID=A0A0A2WL80_9GAMM|nr:hypothetical protein LF41_2737 [Lysobacter dokdonensis DS-58]
MIQTPRSRLGRFRTRSRVSPGPSRATRAAVSCAGGSGPDRAPE